MSTRIAAAPSPMRKSPRQGRSKATVAAILEAGTRILASDGWAGFTTNRVAETAGVSIGSLYQYFPDKQSLVAAIRERHLGDCLAVMRRSTEEGLRREDLIENLVAGLIAAHSIHPGLHRVLLDEAPSAESFRDPDSAFEAEYLGHYRRVVAAYGGGEIGETVAILVSDALDGVIHNAARRGTLGSPELRRELVMLVEAYLAADRRPFRDGMPD